VLKGIYFFFRLVRRKLSKGNIYISKLFRWKSRTSSLNDAKYECMSADSDFYE